MNPHPHPGDDAEHALGSGEQLTKVRPGGRGGGAAQIQHARWSDNPHSADHVIEAAVTGGVLPGGPGSGETADAGEAEALREMPEGETMLAEQALSLRPGDPGAEFCLPGGLVEPVQGVEPAQIQCDERPELCAQWVQPADHAGSATERHHRDSLLRAVVENGGNVVLVAGKDHRIGSVLVNLFAPQQVQCGFTAGVQQPVGVPGSQKLRADDRRQGVAMAGFQGAGGQHDLVMARSGDLDSGHAEGLLEK